MNVLIPDPLRPYTQRSRVEASGRHSPRCSSISIVGIRHSLRMIDEQDRVRRHVRHLRRGEQVFDLGKPLAPDDEVVIVQALSGG